MSQNLLINGVTYPSVDYLALKNTNGETVAFVEGTAVPAYVVEEAESTIAKAASHGILGRTIRFIAISDSHEDSESGYNAQITVSNHHAGQAIAYIADRIGLDFIAHLGDASSAGSFVTEYQFATLRKDIENINKFLSSGSKGIPNVRLVGNHDQFYTTDGKRLFNSGAYDYFGRFCDGNKDTVGGYGFFDIDSAKVRVVYLNTSDVPSATTAGTILAMTDAQKNWICETLIDLNEKDDAADWKILLLSHAPLDFGNVNIATDILLAYVNGESYGDYTFTNHAAQIISNVYGHMHCYAYGYMADKIRRFNIPNACFVGNNHYSGTSGYEAWVDTETYAKTKDSGKDTAFSLVTIDLDSGTCYVDNYGAGIDREFSTDYKAEAVNLFDKNDPNMLDRGRINSSGVAVAYADNQLVTGYIEGKIGDTFTVTTDKANNANGYVGKIYGCNSDKTIIAAMGRDCTTWTWSEDFMSGTVTIPSEYKYSETNSENFEGTVWVRFAVAYYDMANIVITKQ